MTPNYRGGESTIVSGHQTQVQCILNGISIKYILDTGGKNRSCNMFIIVDICKLISLLFKVQQLSWNTAVQQKCKEIENRRINEEEET